MIEEIYSAFLKSSSVVTDTRKIKEGCIFFALKGTNFNGNEFAAEALNKGANWVVIDEAEYIQQGKSFLVKDVLLTLQQLANHHRKQNEIPIIAITGSNGKTTTKELMRDVLSKKYNVLATIGNLNNHIGVPLTLLNIKDDHELAIIEMGANHEHEIEMLCEIAEPNFGIITNIGKAHLEGFGSIEGIIRGKSELYRYVKTHNGVIFYNSRDNRLKSLLNQYSEVISYGEGKGSLQTKLIESSPHLKLKWKANNGWSAVEMDIYGSYNFDNASAAICVGNYFKVEAERINEALSEYRSENNRSQIIERGGIKIYLDAYNANPTSMREAILNFCTVKTNDNMIIVGDMFELGSTAEEEHASIIQLLKDKFKGRVIYVGNIFHSIKKKENEVFKNTEELLEWINENPLKPESLLIKGSRGLKLERVVEYIN